MFPVRLACVRHAASVRPEPGSNSPIKADAHRFSDDAVASPVGWQTHIASAACSTSIEGADCSFQLNWSSFCAIAGALALVCSYLCSVFKELPSFDGFYILACDLMRVNTLRETFFVYQTVRFLPPINGRKSRLSPLQKP